jgi:hypothetical protein
MMSGFRACLISLIKEDVHAKAPVTESNESTVPSDDAYQEEIVRSTEFSNDFGRSRHRQKKTPRIATAFVPPASDNGTDGELSSG